MRELGGRMHTFAHNGDLPPARLRALFPLRRHRPIGDTDSELAFCALLERIGGPWDEGTVPGLEARIAAVTDFAAAIRPLGPANFIYADGDALFVHGHRRFHGDGHPPHAPGLHVLCRHCAAHADAADFDGLTLAADGEQDVVLAASVPLTTEPGWQPLAEGAIVVARAGRIVATHAPSAHAT
jgi:glutamine amidotransferase